MFTVTPKTLYQITDNNNIIVAVFANQQEANEYVTTHTPKQEIQDIPFVDILKNPDTKIIHTSNTPTVVEQIVKTAKENQSLLIMCGEKFHIYADHLSEIKHGTDFAVVKTTDPATILHNKKFDVIIHLI
jgi:hypothetical protein